MCAYACVSLYRGRRGKQEMASFVIFAFGFILFHARRTNHSQFQGRPAVVGYLHAKLSIKERRFEVHGRHQSRIPV